MRDVVLETDAWGGFIMTGYDYLSAYDWARFGLLHLWDGVWEGERILPEGWVDFVRLGPSPGGSERYLNRAIGQIIEALGLQPGIGPPAPDQM